jgi:hypothetical protein
MIRGMARFTGSKNNPLCFVSWRSILGFAVALAPFFMTACAGPATLSSVPGPASDPGRKIYVTRCAKCHKFYDPSKYSNQDWGMWMQKMKKKAKLSDEEEAMVSSYINANLRRGESY